MKLSPIPFFRFIDFSKRAYQPELMDDLGGGGEDIKQALRELEYINIWLGGHHLTLAALKKIIRSKPEKKEWTIIDVGCGRADSLIHIAAWAERKNIKVKLIGIDANPHIVLNARGNCVGYDEIKIELVDIFTDYFAQMEADIFCCTLFTHHFNEEELQYLFRIFHANSKVGWFINDLHRHPIAFYSIKWITHFFSESFMVQNDAPLSVLRSFKRHELKSLVESIGAKPKIRWKWAFRWEVLVLKDS